MFPQMSTGQGRSGAQAPAHQQPSHEDAHDGIPPSVSNNETIDGRQGFTDDRDGSESEYYDDEDQQQQARQHAGGTVLNTPFAPALPPLSSTPAPSLFGRSTAPTFTVPPTVTGRRPFGSNFSSDLGDGDTRTARPPLFSSASGAGAGVGSGRVVPYVSPTSPADTATLALCNLASMYLSNGGVVPPELLSAISASVGQGPAPPVQTTAVVEPVVQEPVSAPPADGRVPSSTFERDAPPHLNRSRPPARRDGQSGGVASSSRRVDEPPAVSSFDRNSFDFFACFLDLSRSSPSISNPFYSVMASIRKHIRPSTSHITPLSRRNQWREWDHAVRQVLSQWKIIGFILPMDADVLPGTPAWLRPVPTPDRSGALLPDESLALLAWEDLDLVAREVLGLVVSAQAYRLLLGDLSRRKGSYTARDLYAVLFDRYGHGSWDSGNMVWEKARRMVCSTMDAVPGFVDAYVRFAIT